MKAKAFRLMAAEEGQPTEEIAESNSFPTLRLRAVREIVKLAAYFGGSVTWFVVEVETGKIWFHIGIGNPQSL